MEVKEKGTRRVLLRLDSATLSAADLPGVRLPKANLARTALVAANLTGADMREANLTAADLTDARLCRADLRVANLHMATLRGAHLQFADLRGAKLGSARQILFSFFFTWLVGCALGLLDGHPVVRAMLDSTFLMFAIALCWAAMGVRLHGADLRDADLRGANLTGAHLARVNLQGAYYNAATRWPAGFTPNHRGMVYRED